MVDRNATQAAEAPSSVVQDASWMLVDLLASVVGADDREVTRHLTAMSARGTTEGQLEIVAGLWQCGHPDVVQALELLAGHHPDAPVAREARKSAMRARTRALEAG